MAEKKTILYGFPREATNAEDIEKIRDSLEEEGYSLSLSDSGDSQRQKILIQKKVENSGNSADFSEILSSE